MGNQAQKGKTPRPLSSPSSVTLTVEGHKVMDADTEPYTLFEISCSYFGTQYVVEKRFSEIIAFHKKLFLETKFNVVQPPPKHYAMWSVTNPVVLAKRKGDLQVYFDKLASVPSIVSQGTFVEFFGIPVTTMNSGTSQGSSPRPESVQGGSEGGGPQPWVSGSGQGGSEGGGPKLGSGRGGQGGSEGGVPQPGGSGGGGQGGIEGGGLGGSEGEPQPGGGRGGLGGSEGGPQPGGLGGGNDSSVLFYVNENDPVLPNVTQSGANGDLVPKPDAPFFDTQVSYLGRISDEDLSGAYTPYLPAPSEDPTETEKIPDTDKVPPEIGFWTSSDDEEEEVVGRNLPSKDWNKEFQKLNLMKESEAKYYAMSTLSKEFVYVATTYGKVIIGERPLPYQKKSILPLQIGGVAGGEKYILHGILFKFAFDLYGIYGSDQNAQKAASHDLKGLMGYWMTNTPGLHYPFMAIIHYMGYCLIAMSLLPLETNSLKYGSNDGGKTVHFDSPELNKKIKHASKKLNLKGHIVGNSKNLSYGPGDLEGHLGTDNRFYILDFARTFPPEACLDQYPENGQFLYKLLRPELVSKWKKPLSSDAFTGWGKHDSHIHDTEVRECTEDLFKNVIPEFVNKISSEPKFEIEDYKEDKLSSLVSLLHSSGINIRHLGAVRELLLNMKKTYLATLSLVEMVSRILKNLLQLKWRQIIEKEKYVSKEKCKKTVVDMLNKLIHDTPGEQRGKTIIPGENLDEKFWNSVKILIIRKFRSGLSESDVDFYPHNNDFYKLVCFRVFYLAGIVVSDALKTDLTNTDLTSGNFPFLLQDIKELAPRAKHMHIIDIADARTLLYSGLNVSGASSARIFQVALDLLKKIPFGISQMDFFLSYVEELREKYKKELKSKIATPETLELAQKLLDVASEIGRDDPRIELEQQWIIYYKESKDDVQFLDQLIKLHQKHPTSVTILSEMIKFGLKSKNKKINYSNLFPYCETLCKLDPKNGSYKILWARTETAAIVPEAGGITESKMTTILDLIQSAISISPEILDQIPITNWTQGPKILLVLKIYNTFPLLRERIRTAFHGIKIIKLGNSVLFSDADMEILLEHVHGVTEFEFGFCDNISPKILADFVVKNKETLTSLSVESCPTLTQDFASVVATCEALTELKITSCVWCTGEGIFPAQVKTISAKKCENWNSSQILQALRLETLEHLSVDTCPLGTPLADLFLGNSLSELFLLHLENIPTDDFVHVLQNSKNLVDASVLGSKGVNEVEFIGKTVFIKHPTLERLVTPEGYSMFYSGRSSLNWNWLQRPGTQNEYTPAPRAGSSHKSVTPPPIRAYTVNTKRQLGHYAPAEFEISSPSPNTVPGLPQILHLTKNGSQLAKLHGLRQGNTSTYKLEFSLSGASEFRVQQMQNVPRYRLVFFGLNFEVSKSFNVIITIPPSVNMTWMVPLLMVMADQLLNGKAVML